MPVSLASTSGSSIKGAILPIGTYDIKVSNTYYYSFQNIPQGYQDLMAVVSTRSTFSSGLILNLGYSFNAGSATQSYLELRGDGSASSSNRVTSLPGYATAGFSPTINNAPNVFSSTIIHVLNYANTNTFKTILSRSACHLVGNGTTSLFTGLWQSTNAINRFDIFDYGGGTNFLVEGSTISLYAIRRIGQ